MEDLSIPEDLHVAKMTEKSSHVDDLRSRALLDDLLEHVETINVVTEEMMQNLDQTKLSGELNQGYCTDMVEMIGKSMNIGTESWNPIEVTKLLAAYSDNIESLSHHTLSLAGAAAFTNFYYGKQHDSHLAKILSHICQLRFVDFAEMFNVDLLAATQKFILYVRDSLNKHWEAKRKLCEEEEEEAGDKYPISDKNVDFYLDICLRIWKIPIDPFPLMAFEEPYQLLKQLYFTIPYVNDLWDSCRKDSTIIPKLTEAIQNWKESLVFTASNAIDSISDFNAFLSIVSDAIRVESTFCTNVADDHPINPANNPDMRLIDPIPILRGLFSFLWFHEGNIDLDGGTKTNLINVFFFLSPAEIFLLGSLYLYFCIPSIQFVDLLENHFEEGQVIHRAPNIEVRGSEKIIINISDVFSWDVCISSQDYQDVHTSEHYVLYCRLFAIISQFWPELDPNHNVYIWLKAGITDITSQQRFCELTKLFDSQNLAIAFWKPFN